MIVTAVYCPCSGTHNVYGARTDKTDEAFRTITYPFYDIMYDGEMSGTTFKVYDAWNMMSGERLTKTFITTMYNASTPKPACINISSYNT